MKTTLKNQKGILHLAPLVIALGIIAFIAVTSIFSFKNSLFNNLFPKPGSFASGPISPVTVSGKVFDLATSQVPQAAVGMTVDNCQTNKPVVDSNGNFSFTLNAGTSFCIRGPNISGYNYPPSAINRVATSPRYSTYEWQLAGYACSGTDKDLAICTDTYDLEDRIVDSGYDLAYTSATNFVKNPGCEVDANNWGAWHGVASRVTNVAHSGVASCQAALNTTDTVYTLDDIGYSVTSPLAGQVYTATAWVRSDTAVGKPVSMILRQWKNGVIYKNTEIVKVSLSTNWQGLYNTVTIDPGVTSLDIYFPQYNAVSGNSFQVDDISLKLAAPKSFTWNGNNINLTTSCYTGDPTFDISFKGSVKTVSSSDGVWITVSGNGQSVIAVYQAGNYPNSVDLSGYYNDQVTSIRGEPSLPLKTSGSITYSYEMKAYSAPFTYGIPTLTNQIGNVTFATDCK